MILSITFAHAQVLIDDFERPASPRPWSFYNGREFPGATGSLSSGFGHNGRGAHLAYNFTGGGAYVSADLNLATPLAGQAIEFWAKARGGCWISLRVRDMTGQTLQYTLSRPLEARDSNAWYHQVVELDAPNLHSGGANDGVLHGKITGISIMASNFALYGLEQGLTGAIDFDDVAVIPTLRMDLYPFGWALLGAPLGKANLMADLGVAIHFPQYPNYTIDTAALDAVRDAGFSWVRMDLFWWDIETTRGLYNFSRFDALLTAVEARGLKPLFILDYANPLHSDCPPNNPPDYCFLYGPQSTATIQAFGRYAQAAAAHFAGHGVRYEVWNEPNISTFWKPTPNATHYSALAHEAITRLHVGDPSALVTTAGLSLFDFRFLRSVLSLGGAAGTDAIGIHPYRNNAPESATDELVHLRSIVDAGLSAAVPIWDTEWGYSSQWFGGNGSLPAARNRQAVLVLRKILSAQVMGFPLSIYYDIHDDGTDPTNFEHNFGLLANNYSDKPAMTAVRTLKAVTANRTFVGSLPTQPTSLHAIRLDASTDSVVVLWSDQPGGHVNVTLSAPATATNMFGAPFPLSTSNGRVIVPVSERDGPVYVRVSSPPGHLANISTRLRVGTSDNVLIGGLIIQGTQPKRVVVRAIGPGLTRYGVPNALADPTLELHDGSGALIATNDNWHNTEIGGIIAGYQAGDIQNSGLVPGEATESAIFATLNPGNYTAIVRGKDNTTGVGLVEAYDLDPTAGSKLGNISTRGLVQTGDNVMIGGSIIQGTTPKRLIVRAIGPELTQYGVPNALADPTLELHDGTGALIGSNDNWQTTITGGIITTNQVSAIQSSGHAPTAGSEAAIVATLPPGNYTAIVRGKNNTTGVALVEVYDLD